MNTSSDAGTETMIDHLAEDVAVSVTERMPTDERTLDDTIRLAFERETGMGREILADRGSSARERVVN